MTLGGADERGPRGGTAPALPIEIFQPEFVEFGGEERVILALARELHRRGFPVAVLCLHNQIRLEQYADLPLPVLALQPRGSVLGKARALARHLAERRAAGAPAPMLCNIQSAYLAGMAVRTPYHLRIPDTFRLLGRAPTGLKGRARAWLLDRLVGRGIRRALTFSTNTRVLRDEMSRLYGRSADVLYLGGVRPPPPPPKHVDGPVRALSVSRIQSSKRIDWMIDAMAILARERPDLPAWTLDVVGKGPALESLTRLAAERGVANRVHFLGFVPDNELRAVFLRSHLFLMPAVQGYGIPAIEALNARLGVVLAAESGVCEILDDTPWAVVTEGTAASFRDGIATMLARVTAGDLLASPLFPTPTEPDWADQLIALSGW